MLLGTRRPPSEQLVAGSSFPRLHIKGLMGGGSITKVDCMVQGWGFQVWFMPSKEEKGSQGRLQWMALAGSSSGNIPRLP